MQTVAVQDRQTLFDLAIQHCGDREAAFQIAEMNDISLTAALSVGLPLQIPEPINQRVVNYYANNAISPATATAELESETEGMTTNDGQYQLKTNDDNFFITNNS